MIKAVIFDLDGTLTKTPSPWRHIHERLGVWQDTACTHLDEWLSGRMDYDEFCRRDTSLWKGKSVAEIHALLDEIELNRNVPAVVERLVSRRVPSVIISSGFSYIASKIQARCNWEPLLIFANELISGPDVRIHVSGDFGSPISKKALADRALGRFGAAASDTLVVSDTVRDLEQLCHCRYQVHVRDEDDLLHVNDYLD